MTTFDYDNWWDGVCIEDLSVKMQLEDWFLESGLTSNILIGFDFQQLQLELFNGWETAVIIAVQRLGEFSHRYFYHASFIPNAAFYCIGV